MRYHVLDVFTDRALSGNPLAVVEDADALDGDRMQAIAAEFNLSETVFLLRPRRDDAVARLRIFTPQRELPFAGHPTVGAACLLGLLDRLPQGEDVSTLLEEEVGPIPIRVRCLPGQAPYAQLTTAVKPSFDPQPFKPARLAEILGLSLVDIETREDAPSGASCGVPFNLVPLKSLDALARARLQLHRYRAGSWADSFYLYCRDGQGGAYRARMFAPDMGIGEDPATGSAAAAFAGYLAERSGLPSGTLNWVIHQGVEMGRPSRIDIEAERLDGRTTAIRVGGHSVPVASGTLTL